jgi:hypothetical protein
MLVSGSRYSADIGVGTAHPAIAIIADRIKITLIKEIESPLIFITPPTSTVSNIVAGFIFYFPLYNKLTAPKSSSLPPVDYFLAEIHKIIHAITFGCRLR